MDGSGNGLINIQICQYLNKTVIEQSALVEWMRCGRMDVQRLTVRVD
jgi:hypothetical protein